MTPTELAIQKALEGGYAEGYELFEINPLTLVRFHRLGAHSPWTWQKPLHSILLDPKWWQALAKMEGWWEKACKFCGEPNQVNGYCRNQHVSEDYSNARFYQRRLIDAIQQGRSIDEFFGEILKK